MIRIAIEEDHSTEWSDCVSDCPAGRKIDAHCALLSLPACYTPVPAANAANCPAGPDQVDVFVKCYRGKPVDGKQRKAIWFMQGGPGGTPVVFEPAMMTAKLNLGEEWDACYMDHR